MQYFFITILSLTCLSLSGIGAEIAITGSLGNSGGLDNPVTYGKVGYREGMGIAFGPNHGLWAYAGNRWPGWDLVRTDWPRSTSIQV